MVNIPIKQLENVTRWDEITFWASANECNHYEGLEERQESLPETQLEEMSLKWVEDLYSQNG